MKKSWVISILFSFIVWKVLVFLTAFISTFFFPTFGDRFPYYQEYLVKTGLPFWIWGFGNFDGVHYLRISIDGYRFDFTQVFFPLYPYLIKLFSFDLYHFWSGLIISNVLFILCLIVLFKLHSLDFKLNIVNRTLIFLLAFPTAFYFGSIYSESLLILLVCLSFLCLRGGNFILGGLFASLASTTRVFGILLTPILIYEFYLKYRNKNLDSKVFLKDLLGVLIAPLGMIFYMIYLKFEFNNPFYFLTAQPMFGAERSSLPIVTLPQVLFRYLKILISVPINSLTFFNAVLELGMTLFVIYLLYLSYKKVRFSYWFFCLGCLLLPTLTGTLSSMPRYALMSFLLFPVLITKLGKYLWPVLILFGILQAILLMLFIRGYWVA